MISKRVANLLLPSQAGSRSDTPTSMARMSAELKTVKNPGRKHGGIGSKIAEHPAKRLHSFVGSITATCTESERTRFWIDSLTRIHVAEIFSAITMPDWSTATTSGARDKNEYAATG